MDFSIMTTWQCKRYLLGMMSDDRSESRGRRATGFNIKNYLYGRTRLKDEATYSHKEQLLLYTEYFSLDSVLVPSFDIREGTRIVHETYAYERYSRDELQAIYNDMMCAAVVGKCSKELSSMAKFIMKEDCYKEIGPLADKCEDEGLEYAALHFRHPRYIHTYVCPYLNLLSEYITKR